jgi:hypothetical protein
MSATISEQVQGMYDKFGELRLDALKFEKGNKAAATRLTKGLQDIRNQIKDLRAEVFTAKKAMK